MIESGDVVEYIGCSKEQIRWGGNDDPAQSFLIVGREYIVDDVEVHPNDVRPFTNTCYMLLVTCV